RWTGPARSQPARRDLGDEDGPGPEVVELVHDAVRPAPRDHRPYGAPRLVVEGAHRRGLQARGQLDRLRDELGRAVVVEEDVLARPHDPREPAVEHVDAALAGVDAADEHRLAAEDRLAEDVEPLLAESGPRLDDVRDGIGDAEGDRRLDRAVQADDLGRDPLRLEVAADEAGVGGRHAAPVEVGGAARLTGPAGEAEGRPAETQAHDLGGRGPGVEEEVAAGDAG